MRKGVPSTSEVNQFLNAVDHIWAWLKQRFGLKKYCDSGK